MDYSRESFFGSLSPGIVSLVHRELKTSSRIAKDARRKRKTNFGWTNSEIRLFTEMIDDTMGVAIFVRRQPRISRLCRTKAYLFRAGGNGGATSHRTYTFISSARSTGMILPSIIWRSIARQEDCFRDPLTESYVSTSLRRNSVPLAIDHHRNRATSEFQVRIHVANWLP